MDKEKELLELYKQRQKDRRTYEKSRRWARKERTVSHIKDSVYNHFKKDKEAIGKLQQTKAILAWPELVGHSAAQVSKAIRVRGSQLVVQVDDPMWMQQLLLLKYKILQKYRKAFPYLALKDIFFVRKLT